MPDHLIRQMSFDDLLWTIRTRQVEIDHWLARPRHRVRGTDLTGCDVVAMIRAERQHAIGELLRRIDVDGIPAISPG